VTDDVNAGGRDDGEQRSLPMVNNVLDAAIRQASELSAEAVDRLRTQYPDASDAVLVNKLEALFTATVTTTGAATGAAGALPGVGTVAALAAGVGDGTFFLTASATHVLAVADVHGIHLENYERQRALLLMILTGGGMAAGMLRAAGRTGAQLGARGVKAAPLQTIREINRVLGPNFVAKYGTKRAILVLGRAAPFGIGFAIGGGGNFLMARDVVKATRKAFD
jgi:hypothetical protein